jgi:hypothetical protein
MVPRTWKSAVGVVATLLIAGSALARPVVTGVAVADNRILDLSGSYSYSSGPVSCQLTLVQTEDGNLAVGAYVTGAGAAKTFVGASRLKAAGDGMSWKANLKSDDGFSLRLVASFVDSNGGQFSLEGSLKGPLFETSISGTITPQDTARGFGIGPENETDHTRQLHSPFFDRTGNATLNGTKGAASITVKETFVKATLLGTIAKVDKIYNWTSGPGSSVVRLGKLHLVVPPSRIFVTLVNSNS